MKLYKGLFLVLVLSLVFLSGIVGCDKAPEALLMEAEDAIKQAKNIGADELTPRIFDQANAFLSEAKSLNAQGKYKEAKKKADSALIRAQKAIRESTRLNEAHENSDSDGY